MFGSAYANVDFTRTEVDKTLSAEDQKKQAALLADTNYNYLKNFRHHLTLMQAKELLIIIHL